MAKKKAQKQQKISNNNPLYSNLPKDWVIGFTDGEGCFGLDVHIKRDMSWGLQMQAEFTIVQHERDKALLEKLTTFFDCGTVGVNRKDKTSTRFHYRVKNIVDLHNKVIPFFDAHPLLTEKNNEFKLFKQMVKLMYDKTHLNSLKDFLDVIDLGEELSTRGKGERSEAINKKRENVNNVLTVLRSELLRNPNLTKKHELKHKLPFPEK